jgi:hypothetical protein
MRMTQTKDDSVPRWVWRLALGGAVLVVAVTISGAVLLGLGAADPPNAGPVIWSDVALRWAAGPEVVLGAGEAQWFDSPPDAVLPEERFTLDVRARLSGDSGAGAAWGIWLETQDGTRVIYAISGEGYTTTRRCENSPTPYPPPHEVERGGPPRSPIYFQQEIEDCPALRPEWRWFAYPRINPPGETNTITLHVERPGEVRLRINGEIMGLRRWRGAALGRLGARGRDGGGAALGICCRARRIAVVR